MTLNPGDRIQITKLLKGFCVSYHRDGSRHLADKDIDLFGEDDLCGLLELLKYYIT